MNVLLYIHIVFNEELDVIRVVKTINNDTREEWYGICRSLYPASNIGRIFVQKMIYGKNMKVK